MDADRMGTYRAWVRFILIVFSCVFYFSSLGFQLPVFSFCYSFLFRFSVAFSLHFSATFRWHLPFNIIAMLIEMLRIELHRIMPHHLLSHVGIVMFETSDPRTRVFRPPSHNNYEQKRRRSINYYPLLQNERLL
jgi:hypothetical protein